jgi:calcium-dependent protein kinase
MLFFFFSLTYLLLFCLLLVRKDIDGSGKIRYTEFLAATIEARGAISEQRLAEAFDRLDRYVTTVLGCVPQNVYQFHTYISLWYFSILSYFHFGGSSDDTGYISAENLRELLGANFPQSEIDSILMEASKRKDRKVTYADFLALWEEKNEQNRSEILTEIRDLNVP